MARKPTEFGHDVDVQIEARTARGESAETIARALGMPEQARTIQRRQAKLRGGVPVVPSPPVVQASPVAPAGTEGEEVPDEIPENVPLEQIDYWIRCCNRGAKKAEQQENWPAVASLVAKVHQLMDLRRKLTPLPKPDPNDHPDYLRMADEGERLLLQLANDLFRSPQGP